MSFRKMRLIPDHLYEKLHQDQKPRSVDFGDDSNAAIMDMTREIEPVLRDTDKPIEERVRILHQHLVRKIASRTREEEEELKKEETAKQQPEKKQQDKELVDDDKATSIKMRDMAIAQRNHVVLGKQVITFMSHSMSSFVCNRLVRSGRQRKTTRN